ncbi:HNH endonuclease signature motif containing protein [Humibacter sp. RRB41]|uniref:HNH endonuclease signature motif containing protein n=1 Tax=Humibacter sp. RRB41 TaxID=2919946 RepID=UPI001FAB1FC4|nr:HNH endonuclease signature motif containing protein [Humibacter sp. RRB41]
MHSHLTRLAETTELVCSLLGDVATVPTSGAGCADATDTAKSSGALVDVVRCLNDADLETLLADAARGRAEFDRVIAIGAGEAAKRSRRELGHAGLAQRRGYRGAAQLVQSLTGESKGEAARQVKVGELLGEAAAIESLACEAPIVERGDDALDRPGEDREHDDSSLPLPNDSLPWQHPVTRAINDGTTSAEAGHLIVRVLEGVTDACPDEARRAACEELVAFASGSQSSTSGIGAALREDLLRNARQVRDAIDVDGIAERYERRFEKRSLKTWHDNDGALNVHVVCDDESGVFVSQLLDMSLSPRRGGPRFTDPAADDWARDLLADPRSNEQLAFDNVVAVLRAGAACDDSTVFRGERPGVRVITVVDLAESEQSSPHGEVEGSGFSVPGWLVTATVCDAGVTPVRIDCTSRTLDLGRDQRSFSAAQRTILRLRDGGCLWPSCDRPAWQAEAHHINPWSEGGRTDVADGVLLCKFHHLNLHNNYWRIVRNGTQYSLIPPADHDPERRPVLLRPKSATFGRILERAG